MKQIWAVTRKELSAYFGSPMALIFVGAFLVVTLFTFFWADAFFARNLADVRPLFRWMPVLLLFLVAALTMRQWSEEQRSGTLEVLLTLPVNRVRLAVGKFVAVVILVALALALTLFLPITVRILGDLDWGPVVGGYLAALLLASAYAAIGLFVSSRTDNQIVALIATVALSGLFYLVGSDGVTGLLGEGVARVLRAIGTGSRFESIQRGVIDLRDLVYYLSLTVAFLALNVLSLDAKRWSRGTKTAAYRRQAVATVVLIAANLLALNAWMFRLPALRADLTADRQYSLSPATRALVSGLQEPLLIRGYFSDKTHPLLAPLVPTILDMLREYEIASKGKIRVEVMDPRNDPAAETEANQVYGIQPTPFQVQERYESSIINSYFDILVRYGDQHATLGFQDLIEVESGAAGNMDVRLRNLEYDLTRTIKKAVYGFQDLGSAFASFQDPIQLTAFVTPGTLPAGLETAPATIEAVAKALQEQSGGKFEYKIVDPDAAGSPVTRDSLYSSYGIRPFAAGLFSPDTYYLHLLLQIGDEAQVLYPSGDLSEASIRSDLEAAIKRAAPGFLKKVGLWVPQLSPQQNPFGGTSDPISSWNLLQQQLAQTYTVETVDLSMGRVAGDIDALVVVAPQNLTDVERYAIDQYLMRGGSLIVATSTYALSQQQFFGGITVEALPGTLADQLKSYGAEIGTSMVLDPQNEPFPIQTQRTVGGMEVTQLEQVDYVHFIDVRRDGMAKESPITANLPAVTLQWASPVTATAEANPGREVTVLLRSTAKSWTSASSNVVPDTEQFPPFGFAVEGKPKSYPLAVAIRGTFQSYFQGKESPLAGTTEPLTGTLGTVEQSQASARLVVVGSNEFVDDAVLQLSQSLSADRYLNNLQLVQNAVDWSVEDEDLLSIRVRGSYARLLMPLDKGQQSLAEGVNYVLALLALLAIAGVWTARRRREQPMALVDPAPASPTMPSAKPRAAGQEE